MKRFLVCHGIIFIKGPKLDSALETLLETCPAIYKKDSYVPEMNTYLEIPVEADSEEEIKDLAALDQFDLENIFVIIDTELQYAHVCNKLNIEDIQKHCLDRFLSLYKIYSGITPVIKGVGTLYLKKTFIE